MSAIPSLTTTSRRRRLLASCLSSAALMTNVESFSLSQNAANAAREDNSPTASSAESPCGRSTARSRAAVIAAGSSLHSRHRHRHGSTWKKRWTDRDDFALRAVQVQQQEELADVVDDVAFVDSADSSSMSSCIANNNCEPETLTTTTSSSAQHQDTASVLQQRRKFLHNFVASTAAIATAKAATSTTTTIDYTESHHNPFTPEAASAFEYTYPIELTSAPLNVQDQTPSNSLSKLQQERLTNKRSKVLATQNELSSDPLGISSFASPYDGILLVTGVSLWTLALWFISGSRSNPLVNPIANVLYNVNDDSNADDTTLDWLRNRNNGYFAEYPPQLTIVLGILFLVFGIIADRSIYFLADGEATIPVELGGVAAISGAFWEVGRIAAGEKSATKEESDRESLIEGEFEEFASKRLVSGRSSLSVHRSEVVKAFRRYNPKYRVENDEYPLSDIEIERVARAWARRRGIDMSGAGFFSGLGIDSDADAFAPR